MILCRPGDHISDDGWEEFRAADVAVWKSACTHLASKTYQNDQWDVTVSIDWRPAVRRLQHNHKITARGFEALRSSKTYEVSIWKKYRHSDVSIPCKVSARSTGKEVQSRFQPSSYAANFVYDVFLALNLAEPGSCDFFKARIASKSPTSPLEIDLANYWFDLSFLNGRKNKWPAPTKLPLHVICDWSRHVRVGLSQIPNNQMEKVLFALWHLSVSKASPNDVIWIFYGLETLFDTKAGENFRTLHQRIAALLSATKEEEKVLKKNLRNLYDLRSAFVHGGLEVIHPLHDESCDSRVDEKYWRVENACEFGFSVLLRSLQEVISRNLYALRYEERIISDAVGNLGQSPGQS